MIRDSYQRSQHFSRMRPEEKKLFILGKMENGDKRSYNEISADLELELWAKRFASIKEVKENK